MSSQALQVLIQGKNESKAAFAELQQDAKLSKDQIAALFQAGANERVQMLADFQKTNQEVQNLGREVQSVGGPMHDLFAFGASGAGDMAEAFAKGVSPVKELGDAAKHTHDQFDELGHAFATGLGIASFLTVAGAMEKALAAIKDLLVEAIKGTAEYAHEIENASLKTGLSVEATQRLKVAAEITGSSLQQVTQAITQMERRVEDGTTGAAKALEKLHLSPDIFKDPEEAALALSRAMREIPTAQERISIGYGLMGKGAQNVMPLLLQDLDALNERTDRLGITMGEDDVKAAAGFAREIELLKLTMEGLIHNIGLIFDTTGEANSGLKNITDTVGNFSQAVKIARPFLQDYLALIAKITGIEALRQGLEGYRLVISAIHEVMDNQQALHSSSRVVAGDTDRYFKETAAEQASYLKAVMQNHDIEERAAKQHEATLAKIKAEATKVEHLLNDSRIRMMNEFNKQVDIDHRHQMSEGVRFLGEQERNSKEEQRIIDDNTRHFIADVRKRDAERKKDLAAQKRDLQESLRNLREVEGALRSIGSAFGGALGTIFGSLSSALSQVGKDLQSGMASKFEKSIASLLNNPKVRGALNGIAAAVQAAFQGYSMGKATGSPGKGAAAGAASGALAGVEFGVPGMIVGGLIGGIAGFLGGKKAQSEARAAMEQMRTQLLQQYGSLEALRKSASLLGVDISRAFSTRDPKVFQATVDQLNQALADQQRRLQGIQTAMQGLDLMTKGFAATMADHGLKTGMAWDEAQEKLKRYERALRDAGVAEDDIRQRVHQRENQLLGGGPGGATDTQIAAFKRLGDYAAATFAAMVKESGDVVGALQQLEPTLSQLAGLEQDFGLQGSLALQQLLGLRQIVVDNADIAQSIQGLNLLMKGLGDAGIQTAAIFQDFGKDAVADFEALKDRGVDANQALILMQPSLQSLWEHQQKFHDITDEATLALLNQAETAGIVGEDQKSIYGQILDVLKDIRDTLMGLDGKTVNTTINTHRTHSGDPPPDDPPDPGGGGGGGNPKNPGNPGTRSGGGWSAQGSGYVPMSGRSGGGRVTHVHVYLDGQELKGFMKRQNRAGRLNLAGR